MTVRVHACQSGTSLSLSLPPDSPTSKYTHTHRVEPRHAPQSTRVGCISVPVPSPNGTPQTAQQEEEGGEGEASQPEPCAHFRRHSFWPACLPALTVPTVLSQAARASQHSPPSPRAELRRGRDETRTPSCGITPAGKTAPPLISSPALSLSLDIPSSHFTIEPIGLREPKTAAGRKGRAGGRAWWLPPAGCATRRISLLSLH